jgi:hypothetical protein
MPRYILLHLYTIRIKEDQLSGFRDDSRKDGRMEGLTKEGAHLTNARQDFEYA